MLQIDVNETTSYGTCNQVKLLIDCFGGKERIERVCLDVRTYTANKRPDGEYRVPVRIYTTITDGRRVYEVEINAFMFTCGYGGSGPTDLVDLLRYTGVVFNESEIFTEAVISKTLYRAK